MTTILITGANRGIGLGLARHAAERGYTVIGTARNPENAGELKAVASRVEQLHTDSVDSVNALAEKLRGEPIDVLINNAGIFPHECDDINDLDLDALQRVIQTNTLGPIMLTRALIPNLEQSKRKTSVSITSNLGSITDASKGQMGFLGYRTSKAALNMANATMAHQLKPKGINCVVIHPGWVQTDMGGQAAPLTPDDSTRSIMDTIDGLSMSDTGRFVDYQGKELPW
ncbi:MAG: SDR family oxidoreductase [Phycisphaerales bacterium]|nr:SDR family oxidoreductase [Phycisphaerales bacterium]